jgi:dihydrofolate synthase/folylpolyglutamate synthase
MKKISWPQYTSDGDLKKYDLERIEKFMEIWGNPQDKIPPIFHIAGTNGKGSTTAFLKYILEANDYLVHRFISPHLVNFNERIEVSGKIITDDYLNQMIKETKEFAEKNNLSLSYFEGTFAIAINSFLKNPAVATILEVGLGGRLDATNSIHKSLITIMTYISLDHTKTLGETHVAIAKEKSGIIKENGILIINKQKSEILDVFYKIGKEKNNKIYSYGNEWFVEKTKNGFIFEGFNKKFELPKPALDGEHQIYNAGGAIAGLLAQNEIKISEKSMIDGLKNVEWNGRLQNMSKNKKLMQYLSKNTELIIDGAHNDSGANSLKKWLKAKNDKKYNILIVSMLERKNSEDFIKNLEKCFDLVITIKMENEDKSKESNEFKEEFLNFGWKNVIAIDGLFLDALKYVGERFKEKENLRVVISGSLYLMGEVLEYCES